MIKNAIKNHIFPVIMILAGSVLAAFSIECFLLPNTILDGGVTGTSMIINKLTSLPLSVLIVVINIPFFIVGFKALGKQFLLRAVIAIATFSSMLEVFAVVEPVTDSELLAVVFGGVVLGVGVGLVLRFGGCLDGTEIAAMLLSKKIGLSTGGVIFAINIVIYSVAGFCFTWTSAMYSLLTYFITFKIIDIVEVGLESAKAAMIITDNAKLLADEIYRRLGRTCTFISAEGLVSGSTKTVLYCVITRVEVNELKRIIHEADVSAFVTISEVSEILGNHIKSSDAKKTAKPTGASEVHKIPGAVDAPVAPDATDTVSLPGTEK
ncbi:MAG: YitT family protein [Oscillospiraceae bacterium]|nr:YitT family protein [Oscillospiraceae bacterium]